MEGTNISISISEAVVIDHFEFHLVGGCLFITKESDPDVQIQLTAEETLALLDYLRDHKIEIVETIMRDHYL